MTKPEPDRRAPSAHLCRDGSGHVSQRVPNDIAPGIAIWNRCAGFSPGIPIVCETPMGRDTSHADFGIRMTRRMAQLTASLDRRLGRGRYAA